MTQGANAIAANNKNEGADSAADLALDSRRRALLKSGAVLGGYTVAAGSGLWSQFALAQGEEVVPFTDMPDPYTVPPVQAGAIHYLDTSQHDSFFTPNDDFYIVQHYDQPDIGEDVFRLNLTGMVDKPLSLSMADIKDRPKLEVVAGFECGGNSGAVFQGLIGNARWGGCSLKALLEEAGVQPGGIEVVFYGNDKGIENVRDTDVEVAFGRSMHIDDAMMDQVMLAYEMNGEPLPLFHGAPLRLLVPGWYGVSNVKWLSQIHVQDRRYMGRFMARDYVTLSKRMIGGEERWEERSVTRMRLKSSVIRVTKQGDQHNILGFALNDGTPLERVEVSIDGGPWQKAVMDSRNTQYSLKFFNYHWQGAEPGEHTVVSRAIDVNGQVQPTADEMPDKPSRWENNEQFLRRVMIG